MDASQIGALTASATVVIGGLGALMRVIFKAIFAVRDNTAATKALSERVNNLSNLAPTIDRIDARLTLLEAHFLTKTGP